MSGVGIFIAMSAACIVPVSSSQAATPIPNSAMAIPFQLHILIDPSSNKLNVEQ
jgi:hypothetical protein